MSQQRLAEEYETVCELGARADVFTLYYRMASQDHKMVLDGTVRETPPLSSTLYITGRTHFPALRETFNPQTEGRIDLLLSCT